MRFETKNSLRLFRFDEVTLKEISFSDNNCTLVLEALIVKANHPQNEECVERFADISNLRFLQGKLVNIVKEGYKYYDANGNLKEEKPDESISKVAYDGILRQCKDVVLFDIVAIKEQEGDCLYQIGIDLNEEETYWLDIACEGTVMEWEKFLNRVM